MSKNYEQTKGCAIYLSIALSRSCLLAPVLLDVEVPLPGQVIGLVIVGEEGLDVVLATDQHALGRFFHWGHELMFFAAGAVAANHVHCLVH